MLKHSESLLGLAQQLRDMDGLLDRIVDASVAFIKAQLEHQFEEGVGPDGEPWPQAKRGFNAPLVKSGDLRASLIEGVYKGGKGGFYNSPGNWYFGIKSTLPYALRQQHGDDPPGIPPHQIIPYEWPGGWGEGLKAAQAEAMREWFEERGFTPGTGFTR